MGTYWIRPPRPSSRDLATYLEHLRPFGVRMQAALRNTTVSYSTGEDGDLMADIGELTLRPSTGIIAIWPYADTAEPDKLTLARCAGVGLRGGNNCDQFRRTERSVSPDRASIEINQFGRFGVCRCHDC